MKRPNHLLLPVVTALATTLAAAVPARAQQDVVKLSEKLNRKAMEDYDSLEFDSARQTLLSAISKLRDAGQDETPTASKIYMNLGIVYILGFKDKNRGVQQFVNALKIDGTSALDPERATPELQEAFDLAAAQMKKDGPPEGNGGHKKPPRGEDPPLASTVHGLQHSTVDEGKAGLDVPIKAQLGSDVAASRLFLFYRSAGQEDYVSVPMNVNAQGDWVGIIPGEAMEGKAVQYYLEARDARGRPVIAVGAAANPNIITVKENKIETEDPLSGLRHNKDRDKDRDGDPTRSRGFGRIFLNVMGGTAVGIAPAGSNTEVAYLYQQKDHTYVPQPIGTTGTVLGPVHFALEVGVNATRHVGISGMARVGLTLTNNADSAPNATYEPPLGGGTTKAGNDFAGMIRLRYQFLEGKFRPLLHVGVGGGQIRHVIDISGAEDTDHPLVDRSTAEAYNQRGTPVQKSEPINEVCRDHAHCVDTVAMGYLLAGVGGGFFFDLTQFKNGGVGILLDIDAIFGLPVGGGLFGINFDIQLGIGAHFL